MKRKIFATMFCILLLVCVFPVVVFGTEAQEESAMTQDSSTEQEHHTVFSRVWEYIHTNKTEVVTIAGDTFLAVAFLRSVLKSRKKNEGIASQLVSLKKDSAAMPELVDTVNLMIDGFNTMSAEYEKMKALFESNSAADDDRNRVVGALLAQTTAILEIITTGYTNSNLPQGIKDLVTLKYAKCLRSIDDDTAKCAVAAARAAISGVDVPSEESVAAAEGAETEVESAEV